MKQKEKNNIVKRMFNPYVINKTSASGITLVALVVTIIVLIILAGVSINLILGDNGLITKANEAKQVREIAELKEEIKLEIAVKQMEKLENSNGITQSEVEEILLEYGTVNKDSDGKIESLKPTGKEYEIPYEEIVDENIVVSEEENEINLKFGGVYEGQVTLANENGEEMSVFDTGFSFLEDGTVYMGLNVWNTGSHGSYEGLNWCQKNENIASYSQGMITVNDDINIEVSENGLSFNVLKEYLTALLISGGDGSMTIKEDVTFTYTGEQFAEHEPYTNTKYYFISGFQKGDYLELKDDGSFELYLSTYHEYSNVYEEGEIDFNFSFSLDGKILTGIAGFVDSAYDIIAVEENSVVLND